MSFKRLDPEDFLISADSIINPAWSNFSASLTNTTMFTHAGQTGGPSGQYYTNVYNLAESNALAEAQFAIAYGDLKGSGSFLYNSSIPGLSPSRTVYGQFINLLFGEDENAGFNYGGPVANNQTFLAIVVNRARYKQTIKPGSFQLQLSSLTPLITDDSSITPTVEYTNAGRRYTLGSGSFGDGVMPAGSTNGVYGYLYPDVGVIILNPYAIGGSAPLRQFNNNGNDAVTLEGRMTRFFLQSEETVTSDFIFCRARNAEFNYSVNPSFSVSASAGSILYNDFIQNPVTYVTSIGMYNDNNELLAVAKLSKPLKKDFTKEALVRVKLDF
jgi:hypothetical protein